MRVGLARLKAPFGQEHLAAHRQDGAQGKFGHRFGQRFVGMRYEQAVLHSFIGQQIFDTAGGVRHQAQRAALGRPAAQRLAQGRGSPAGHQDLGPLQRVQHGFRGWSPAPIPAFNARFFSQAGQELLETDFIIQLRRQGDINARGG